MTKFRFTFSLPPVGASDVVKRELSTTVGGADPVVTGLTGQPLVTPPMDFDADASVSIVLTDVDGHGNRSQPSAPFAFTVTDDVPPPKPGEIGVATKEQIEVPDVPPAPQAAPKK